VAAKTLLYNAPSGLFKVTIYEAQKRIGGLWPSRKDDTHGLIHPLMVTNLSRHTQQFSDLAWGHDEPQFPRAWMVGRYLERYLDAYPGAEVKLGHRVTKTELQADGCWAVSATPDCGAQEETRVFDHLIVASGFFGTPHYPNSFEQNSAIPVRHSSGYRGLHDLLGEFPNPGDKIVVVGGQLSGVETASNIATDLACTINSATSTSNAGVESYRVHHLIQRPTWVFPLFTSPNVREPGYETIEEGWPAF
jgi:cation diffusion facilitator CzcD-associated flavoprotein CzcO